MQSKEIKVIGGTDPNGAWRISLPKGACRRLGIKPRDTVIVKETSAGMSIRRKDDEQIGGKENETSNK